MQWQNFIKMLKEHHGYEGAGDDFAEVKSWLEENGHNVEFVQGKKGERLELKALFDGRPGKPLDVSGAQDDADRQAEIDNGIQTAVIVGEETNGCILTTARSAMYHDYYVVVLGDCVGSPKTELHEAALTLLKEQLSTSAEIITEWKKGAPGRSA